MPADLWEILRRASAKAPADQSPWTINLPTAAILGSARPPVGDSPDLQRVAALPRRPVPDLDGMEGEALVELTVRRFGRGERACRCQVPSEQGGLGRDYCIKRPFPIQAWAMHEMSIMGGLFAPITVGGGKTFLDMLACVAVPGVRTAVLLVPANMDEQLRREYLAIREHFFVPSIVIGEWFNIEEGGRDGRPAGPVPVLHVVSYSIFQRPEQTDLLERYKPDLIVADEGHRLRNADTATTGRALLYWQKYPETRLCSWSGTFVGKSLTDCCHLSALALGLRSPLPLDPAVRDEWALAVDPVKMPAPSGALGETFGMPLRQGMRNRITETLGVVSSRAAAIDTPLDIIKRAAPPMPAKVRDALHVLRKQWVRPDGERFLEAPEVTMSALQLSCGFYYFWRYPNGESAELIDEWFEARKQWHSELRERLGRRSPWMDSPANCEAAAVRAWAGLKAEPGAPVWKAETWRRWRDVKDLVNPVQGTAWLDDWLAHDAAAWAQETGGIVWYAHEALGARIAKLLGLPLHEGGPGAEARILAEDGSRPIVASINAHGTGRDGLQRRFDKQLFTSPPASGQQWEQVLGRLHRPGQKSERVRAWVYLHTKEFCSAFDSATAKSEFIQDFLHGSQKLAKVAQGLTTVGADTE